MKRVFLDENVDSRLTDALTDCDVRSVRSEGWFGVSNGELLGRIEADFDVLVSHDRGLEHQQTWSGRSLALVVVRSESTDFLSYEHAVPAIQHAINDAVPGIVIVVSITR